MRRVVLVIMSLLIATPWLYLPDTGVRGADPSFDAGAGPDVPVWMEGDSWNYTTLVEYDYLGVATITLSGWMNMSVVAVTLDMFASGEPVYITNMTGNISGEQTIPFIGDVNIYIDITGYVWNRAQDLSVYRSILNASVSGSVGSINGEYPVGYEYSPPLEEYDFPLVEGDEWKVNTSGRLPFGSSGDIASIRQNNTCGQMRPITVPAGTFDVLPVSINGQDSLFYNSTVGRSVKRSYSIDEVAEGFKVPFELDTYERGSYGVEVELDIMDQQQVEAGEEFTISGQISSSGGLVNIFFPGGTLAYTNVLLPGTSDFEADLPAPDFPDHTPTSIDYGSFGIFVSVNGLGGLGVVTVTTKARDVEVDNSSLQVNVSGEGTVDDTVRIRMTVGNPSNFMVDNLTVRLTMDASVSINFTSLVIPGGSELVLHYNTTVDDAGEHTAALMVDPEDMVSEYNETNNFISSEFTVLERPPIEWKTEPPPGNYSIAEGTHTELFARAERAGEEISGIWYLDGTPANLTNEMTFVSQYDGYLSSREEPYVLSYSLDEEMIFHGEKGHVSYNITVEDVNRAHEVISRTPSRETVNVKENSSARFSVDASDPDGDDLFYIWNIGNETFVAGNNLTVVTDLLGNRSSSASPLIVSVVIFDGRNGSHNITLNWTLIIEDVDRTMDVVLSPEPGNITLEYNQTLIIWFNASDPDGTEVEHEWLLPGNVVSDLTQISIDPEKMGLSGGENITATLNLSSGGTNRSFSWWISVGEKHRADPDPPEPVDPEGVRIISPEDGGIYMTNQSVRISAVDEDERNLSFKWIVDGVVHSGREVEIGMLDAGNHTVVLNVTSVEEGRPGWVELSVSFRVVEPEIIDGNKDGSEEKEPVPYWIFILIGAAIIAVVIVAVVIIAVRREEEEIWEE